MNTKQVIVMRTDLNMRKGKMIAQGAHASLGIFSKTFLYIPEFNCHVVKVTAEAEDWLNNSYTKICVGVDSEAALMDIYQKAIAVQVPAIVVTDNGKTEFDGIPTVTCAAIGPARSEVIDEITGGLKLL